MSTKQKLCAALVAAGAPEAMIHKAAAGAYDDYESDSPTPITDLMRDARAYGLTAITEAAALGEFDGTKEEAEAWFDREGRHKFPGVAK